MNITEASTSFESRKNLHLTFKKGRKDAPPLIYGHYSKVYLGCQYVFPNKYIIKLKKVDFSLEV